MKKLIFFSLLLILFTLESFSTSSYVFLKLKGEIDVDNDQYIKITWDNSENLLKDINDGKISEVKVEFDVKLDQGKYLTERNMETFSVGALENEFRFIPFVNHKEMNTDNTMVSVRMRYLYQQDGKQFETEFNEPIILGNNSYVKNTSFWSKSEIKLATKMGLILDSFKDDVRRPISRYEFIKMLMRLNQFIGKTETNSNLRFDDISDEDINLALNLGIVKGISGNTFAGEQSLTKQEMATIFKRYIDILGVKPDTKVDFNVSDFDSVALWAKESVNTLLSYGIIQGDGQKKINPSRLVTSEEAIVMVIRIFEMKK